MPPQSGQPQYGNQPPAKQGKGMAVTALILGVLALLVCWTVIGGVLLGLPAIILGLVASSRAKKGKAGGRGLAITGWVTGLLGLLLAIALTVLAGTFLARFIDSDAAQRYEQCISDAGNQQQQVDQCERQLERDLEDTFGG